METTHQKITQCLWFDHQGEEAAKFYTSVFENSHIGKTTRYTEAGQEIHGQTPGDAMTVEFEIAGKKFMALNGGPIFKINPSISFFINCETEAEVDRFWKKLSEGGKIHIPLAPQDYSDKYGWVEDKFGVSWQVILAKPEGDWRPKIIPSFLFTNEVSGKTEEAIDFYVSLFGNSKIGLVAPNNRPGTEGTTAFADFMLENLWFAAMDSPVEQDYNFNEAVSLMVHCEDQEEIDYFWSKFTENGGQESQCGWLKDRFGVSWQIIPKNLDELLTSTAATETMMSMRKLDIETLKNA